MASTDETANETKELESKLAFLNTCYQRLEDLRGKYEEKLNPLLGNEVHKLQPNVVDAINSLTKQMEELVRRADELLKQLSK